MRILPSLPFTLALILAGCGGGPSPTPGNPASGGGGTSASTCPLPSPLPSPLASPRFSTDILPALQLSCGSSTVSCHGNANPPPGHIRYDTSGGRTATDVYLALINVQPSSAPAGWVLVKPGDPARSWLIEKVTSNSPGGGYGTRMPQGAPDLCQASVDNLKAWIQAGAPF